MFVDGNELTFFFLLQLLEALNKDSKGILSGCYLMKEELKKLKSYLH